MFLNSINGCNLLRQARRVHTRGGTCFFSTAVKKQSSQKQATVLILGGSGVFGSRIAEKISRDNDLRVVIGGRDRKKADEVINSIKSKNKSKSKSEFDFVELDVTKNDFRTVLSEVRPKIVVHTAGPFQNQDYSIAEACISNGVHYIDIADGREYVPNISLLDSKAKEKGVVVISGASTFPAISSAIVNEYINTLKLTKILDLEYTLSTPLSPIPGEASLKSMFSYLGSSFNILENSIVLKVFGLTNLKFVKYPGILLPRVHGYCDIPDYRIFPNLYKDLRSLKFYAGVGSSFLQFLVMILAKLVVKGVVKTPTDFASFFHRTGKVYQSVVSRAASVLPLGRGKSAFAIKVTGEDLSGKVVSYKSYILPSQGHGIHIPTIPCSILVQKLLRKDSAMKPGAYPCAGLIQLKELLVAFKDYDIKYKVAS